MISIRYMKRSPKRCLNVLVKALGGKTLVDYGLAPNEPPEVLWNFEKFLINKNGEVVARFAPDITANDPRIVDAINAELAK